MNKHLTVKKNIHRSYKTARKNRNITRNPLTHIDIPAFVKPYNRYRVFYRTFKTRWHLLAQVDPIHYC